MSKFNKKNVGVKANVPKRVFNKPPDTVNKAGGRAFSTSAELDLTTKLLNSFCKDTYYGSAKQTYAEIVELLSKLKDPKFAAQAAVFARTEFYMRSITHVVACELARELHKRGESVEWFRPFIKNVVQRPDDMLEILSYWETLGETSRPKAMLRGLRDAFDKFSPYQLGKYKGEGKSITLVDLVRIVHPVPNEQNAEALRQLIHGELKAVDTWQNEMSAAMEGLTTEKEKDVAKGNVWREQVTSGKLPYMATLMNLRNIGKYAPDALPQAIEKLTNPQAIKKGKQFPHTYFNTYRVIEADRNLDSHVKRMIMAGLSDAVDISCQNIPDLKNSLVVIDASGSMGSPVSLTPSDMKRYNDLGVRPLTMKHAGGMFAAMLAKVGFSDIMVFASDAKYVDYNPRDTAISIAEKIGNIDGCNGHGTNFHAIFDRANKAYDRIVIFSDMQGWMGSSFRGDAYDFRASKGGAPTDSYARYVARTKANPWIYSCNLATTGTLMFPEDGKRVITLAGYSDKLFELMHGAEMDPKILLNTIKNVEIV